MATSQVGERSQTTFAIGWPPLLPYIEEDNRFADRTTDGQRLRRVMPWAVQGCAPLRDNPLYTDPVKVFVCPASAGLAQPDVVALTSEINAPNQGALHFRPTRACSQPSPVTSPARRRLPRPVYYREPVRLIDIADDLDDVPVGECSSAQGGRPGRGGGAGFSRGRGVCQPLSAGRVP